MDGFFLSMKKGSEIVESRRIPSAGSEGRDLDAVARGSDRGRPRGGVANLADNDLKTTATAAAQPLPYEGHEIAVDLAVTGGETQGSLTPHSGCSLQDPTNLAFRSRPGFPYGANRSPGLP